jgi:hypothetical protein
MKPAWQRALRRNPVVLAAVAFLAGGVMAVLALAPGRR